MPTDHRSALANIRRFDQLIAYLRDEMGWPIARDSFEDVDDLFYDFTADELGIDPKTAAKIESIKRLRPLSPRQPWGIFFVKFEPKKLPVVALRRILSQVALKKRASANSAERTAWAKDDLLFVSNYGVGDERQISFAHFSTPADGHDLPTLKVLGWDNRDTALHLDAVARELTEQLAWPDDDRDANAWREQWRAAFTLRHREVVTTSKELSIRLAELARAIRDRIKTALAIETDRGPLTRLMKAFQASLVHDLDADGFADMYAQTIAYGLLSARIADPQKKTVDDFAAHMRTNPFLRELMETFLQVGGRRHKAGGPGIDFDELGVSDIVELLDEANMEAVVRDFGDRNPREDPVTHFYEGFAKEYDPIDKVKRGEFYTPRPVVSYIVRSVDKLLRTEFGLADGLADITTWGEMAKRHKNLKIPEGVSRSQDFVQILDPATGTGTFLVEVVDTIYKTLVGRWSAQGHGEKEIEVLWNEYVPRHLLPRLHAYELKMAPYAIAHLKIGLKLHETAYHFDSDERARIYLTNALEPAGDLGQRNLEGFLPALAHEAHAVNEIKKHQRFTVVIGNPPYAGISSNMSEGAQRLVDAYRAVDGSKLNERKVWLQDDYVKFIRMAQTTIERSEVGVLGYITNHGYLDNPTFRGMRQSLMGTFGRLCLIDLHGNANRKERSPDGVADENVFDIRQGVAICLGTRGGVAALEHSDLWGSREHKYEWLLAHATESTSFSNLSPDSPYYLFKPQNSDRRAEYAGGWSLPDVFPKNGIGIVTARDALTIDMDVGQLWERVQRFATLSPEKARTEYELGADVQNWKVKWAQDDVRSSGPVRKLIQKVLYRPFDSRHIYYTGKSSGFICRPVRDVMHHMLRKGNIGLVTTRSVEIGRGFEHVFCSTGFIQLHSVSLKEVNYLFPLWLEADPDHEWQLMADDLASGVNFSRRFVGALASALGMSQCEPHGLPEGIAPEDVFQYAYAVLHSPDYRSRYADFLKSDFPRLPLTGSIDLFRALARLGGGLVALHSLQSPELDHLVSTYAGPKNPEVGRVDWSDDTVWLDATVTKKGEAPSTGFHGVKEAVWNFHIGGYQVCEKWLKDRKGRTLSKDDITHYQKIVVALAETIRLMNEIDVVIEKHGGWPGAFAGPTAT